MPLMKFRYKSDEWVSSNKMAHHHIMRALFVHILTKHFPVDGLVVVGHCSGGSGLHDPRA
jgi:protein tyrosine phosphatase